MAKELDNVIALIPVTRSWLLEISTNFEKLFQEKEENVKRLIVGRYQQFVKKSKWFSTEYGKNHFDETNWKDYEYSYWYYRPLYSSSTNNILDKNFHDEIMDEYYNVKGKLTLSKKLLESASLGNDTINITYNTYCKLT